MKFLSLTAFAPLLIATALVSAAPSVPALAPASMAQENEFMEKFRDAMKINAKEEMAKLVKLNQFAAVEAVNRICEAIAVRPSEQLEKEIAALNTAWKDAIKTKFVDIQYEYFSLMRPQVKTERHKLRARYNVQYKKYSEARDKKDGTVLPGVGLEFSGLAGAFAELGDHYLASQAWGVYADCFDAPLRGKDADLARALEGWQNVVAEREKIELADGYAIQCKQRVQTLEAEGAGAPASAGGAKAAPKADAGSATTVEASFELVELDEFRRPHYTVDGLYQIWGSVYVRGNGSTARFGAMAERSPTILRTGAAKAWIDTDQDGEGTEDVDIPIPVTGKMEAVQVTIGTGEEEREWAFIATVGQDQDTYQGFRFNLSPDTQSMNIYTAPAGSMVTTIAETRVQVLDDNMDGIYGSEPVTWGYIGTLKDNFQPDMDSVRIGSSKVAQPWSEYLEIGDTWYQLEPQKGGKQFKVAPVEVKTGMLKLDFKGGKPDWLVVRGKNALAKAFFDLAGAKTVNVPVGDYELVGGMLSKGKRNQKMKALILPSEETKSWSVLPGETVTVELGSPFGFGFTVKQNDETISIPGSSVVVTGRGQETYQRLWNCVVNPDVMIRKAGTKKSTKGGRMIAAGSQEDIQAHENDFGFAWHPYDIELEKKKPGEAEAQLFEKKNKLFGKIESDWKK